MSATVFNDAIHIVPVKDGLQRLAEELQRLANNQPLISSKMYEAWETMSEQIVVGNYTTAYDHIIEQLKKCCLNFRHLRHDYIQLVHAIKDLAETAEEMSGLATGQEISVEDAVTVIQTFWATVREKMKTLERKQRSDELWTIDTSEDIQEQCYRASADLKHLAAKEYHGKFPGWCIFSDAYHRSKTQKGTLKKIVHGGIGVVEGLFSTAFGLITSASRGSVSFDAEKLSKTIEEVLRLLKTCDRDITSLNDSVMQTEANLTTLSSHTKGLEKVKHVVVLRRLGKAGADLKLVCVSCLPKLQEA